MPLPAKFEIWTAYNMESGSACQAQCLLFEPPALLEEYDSWSKVKELLYSTLEANKNVIELILNINYTVGEILRYFIGSTSS